MSAAITFRPLTEKEACDAFSRLEDAQRDAMECAWMLAQHFELLAHQSSDDDRAMFAAMGHEGLALQIVEHLKTIDEAARKIAHGNREGAR